MIPLRSERGDRTIFLARFESAFSREMVADRDLGVRPPAARVCAGAIWPLSLRFESAIRRRSAEYQTILLLTFDRSACVIWTDHFRFLARALPNSLRTFLLAEISSESRFALFLPFGFSRLHPSRRNIFGSTPCERCC